MMGREVLEQVERGYRMPKPNLTPENVYELMLQCWHRSPDRRPTFHYLSTFFDDFEVIIEEPVDYRETAGFNLGQ